MEVATLILCLVLFGLVVVDSRRHEYHSNGP